MYLNLSELIYTSAFKTSRGNKWVTQFCFVMYLFWTLYIVVSLSASSFLHNENTTLLITLQTLSAFPVVFSFSNQKSFELSPVHCWKLKCCFSWVFSLVVPRSYYLHVLNFDCCCVPSKHLPIWHTITAVLWLSWLHHLSSLPYSFCQHLRQLIHSTVVLLYSPSESTA